MEKPYSVGLALAAAMVGLVAACGDGPTKAESVASRAPTVSTPSSAVSSTSTPAVVDLDPANYEYGADRYRFALDGTPLRECVIYPSAGTNVECSVAWPDGTSAAPVQGSVFDGPPNAIVLAPDGFYPLVSEGGPPGAPLLPVNSRVSVDGVVCTAVDGGVECANSVAGFSFIDGELRTSGPTSEPPVVETTSVDDPPPSNASGGTDGVYTDGTGSVRPGTVCGAATGRQPVVEVRKGSISCTDAYAVIDRYNGLPRTDEFGRSNIRQFDGWTCATRSAAEAAEKGYGQTCSSGDVEVATPYFAR